ncbi:hypothetical protein [Pelomonas sp. KK5]|uniref:hypothetical protein n=1 Tax=Pelomonas sp. KK5 TaxID=1855730 RepID=UPI00097C9DD3|nr:hypothetical protein [Pelomonas sp. KK5]
MAKCSVHPGLASVGKVNGVEVCDQCNKQIAAAVKALDKHVEPKGCMVWYEGGKKGWQPIPGTGCAHWLAHDQGIKRGGKGEQCMLGYPFRVSTAVGGRKAVKLAEVKVGDFFVKPDQSHCGLVVKVTPDPKNPDHPTVIIRSDSSAQGKVADNDFDGYYSGKGSFVR